MLDPQRLRELLDHIPRLRIALVGDLFLDRYLEVESDVHELSIETGLEAFQVGRVRNSPGALGTVMNNLSAMGVGRLTPVTVIGDDGHGVDLLRQLPCPPVAMEHILRSAERLTPTYTKPVRRAATGEWGELNRLDIRSRCPLSGPERRRLSESLRVAFAESDGMIVLDQIAEPECGVVNTEIRGLLTELARSASEKLMLIDSRAQLDQFACGVLKGNRSEILTAAGQPESMVDSSAVTLAARQLALRTSRPVFCTLGAAGMLVVDAEGACYETTGIRVSGPVDIVGAGDSATAALTASLLSGATVAEAADVANLVASITVQQLGTTGTASPDQIVARRAELDA